MLEGIPTTWWLLSLVLVVTHLLCFGAGYLLRRSPVPADAGIDQHPQAQTDVSQDEDTVGRLDTRLVTVESALAALEQQVKWLTENRNEDVAAACDDRSFDVATRLAKFGSSVDELVKVCGLGRGEAELIRVLHGGATDEAPDVTRSDDQPNQLSPGDLVASA